MKASEFITEKTRLDPKCWDGYKIGKPKTKKGKKGVRVNNCIPEAGVGIITKQNTTPDVKPGETQRQAKKLGMTLDKKNRPPLLHKKAVKNSSPNTLFNLGLNEHIRKEGNKYTVYSKNSKRKFGTYTSRAEAEKRLRQIEMFKHMG